MTISVLNQKGGVGKTTMALHLAAAWKQIGAKKSIVLLDLDDQESLLRYAKRAPKGVLKGAIFESGSWRELPELLAKPKVVGADIIVIDSPRSLDDALTRAILSKCDAALVPLQLEYDALIATVRTLEVAKSLPNLKIKVALNGTNSQKHRIRIRKEAREELADVLCRTPIVSSGLFGEAAIDGITVFDHAPDSVVAAALLRLAGELGREWGVFGSKL